MSVRTDINPGDVWLVCVLLASVNFAQLKRMGFPRDDIDFAPANIIQVRLNLYESQLSICLD